MENNDNPKTGLLSSLLWNSGGYAFYFVCRYLVTVLVVRLSGGYEDAGYLSLAISVTNIFVITATFNVRNYQVSDIKEDFSNNIYVTARIVTCVLSQLLCVTYCLITTGFGYAFIIINIYMLYICSDAFTDVLHGIAQKKQRLDIVGISFILRGFAVLITFAVLYQKNNLAVSLLGMGLSSFFVVCVFDIKRIYRLSRFRLEFIWRDIIKLLRNCFPLMAAGVLYVLNSTAARLYLEVRTDTQTLGIYSSATILMVIISLSCSLLYTPFINIFTNHYKNADYKALNRVFLFLVCVVTAVVFAAYGLSVLYAADILRLVYGESIVPYAYLLSEAIIVAGLVSFLWLLSAILTVMRRLFITFLGYITGFIVCISTARFAFDNYGISGINYMQMYGFGISVVILLFAYVYHMRKLRIDS